MQIGSSVFELSVDVQNFEDGWTDQKMERQADEQQ